MHEACSVIEASDTKLQTVFLRSVKDAHVYIYLFIRMDYAHSYISKYICTHVYTHSKVCWRHMTERGVISRARSGKGRDIRDMSRRYVSFIFVYVPTLVYSGLPAGRVKRLVATYRQNARSRDDLKAES